MTYKPPKFSDGNDVNWNAKPKGLDKLVSKITPRVKEFTIDSSRKVITPFDQDEIVPYARMVVPVSGGIDSCTSAWLCAQALEEKCRDPNDYLTLLGFIGNGLNPEDQEALKLFKDRFEERFRGLPFSFIVKNIEGLLKDVNKTTEEMGDGSERYVNLTNCRVISMLTMNHGDSYDMAGIDSTNKDEVILGEIALGTGYEISSIGDFYKSMVYELARQIGLPTDIIEREAQNSSLGNSKVKSYFGNLPREFTSEMAFQVLDPVLFCYESQWSVEKTAKKLDHGKGFVQNVFDWCENERRNLRRDVPFYLKIEQPKERPSQLPEIKISGREYKRCFVG